MYNQPYGNPYGGGGYPPQGGAPMGGYQQPPPPQPGYGGYDAGGYNNNYNPSVPMGGYQQPPPPQQGYGGYNPGAPMGGYQQPPPNYGSPNPYNNNYYASPNAYNNNNNFNVNSPSYQTHYNPNSSQIQNTAHQLAQEMPNDPNRPPSDYYQNSSPNQFQSHQSNLPAHNAGAGRKKALLIGVNYIGQATQLNGPSNDTKNVFAFLQNEYRFPPDNMLILSDEPQTQRFSFQNGAMHGKGDINELTPTKAHILKAIAWLVSDPRPGDVLFFHYSGHGGQIKDQDGDEEDGMDEVIFPLDYTSGNHIVDDDLHESMVSRIPAGCRLICLMDCCHSGSGLDLPYSTSAYVSKKRKKYKHGSSYQSNKGKKHSDGETVCWSSCQDSETSADVGVNGVYSGALTKFWLDAMKKYGGAKGGRSGSYHEILMDIWEGMKGKVTSIESIPEMSYNNPNFDPHQPFYM